MPDSLSQRGSSESNVLRLVGTDHELAGHTVTLPSGEQALILSVEHEYDDGATLRYLDGDHAGTLTQRDTYAIRRYLAPEQQREGPRNR